MSLTSLIATSSSIPSEIHKDLSLYGIIDIQNEVIGSVPLTVRGASGQTANLIEAKNYAGTTVFSVDNSGNVVYLGDEYVTDHLTVNGIADLLGDVNVTGLLTASGGIDIAAGGLSVIGDSTFDNQVSVHNLVVSGDAEFRDNLILTNGKQILANSGTAAKPSITFASDPDTGFYSYSANAIGIATGGTSYGFISGGAIAVDIFRSLGANLVTLKGNTPDGATAVGAVIDNAISLTTSGAKICSFRNATVEKAYIDRAGFLYSDQIAPITATSLKMVGLVTDGATAVGGIFDNFFALTTAGAKILSIRNATVEKAAIGLAGEVMAGAGTALLPSLSFLGDPNTGIYSGGADDLRIAVNGTLALQVSTTAVTAWNGIVNSNIVVATSASFITVKGNIADGASAIGLKFGNVAALTTAGAKIASFYSDNLSTEKAYIDCQGKLSLGDSSPLYLYPQERTPSVCVAGTPSAGGSVTDGTHSYKVTFVTAEGESTPSAKSNVITCGAGNNTVAITGIPIGGARVTARKVYRTDAGDAGNYKLIETIANNTATTTTDTGADGVGAAAPTVNTTTNLFVSAVADSATANGFVFNTAALSTAGANLIAAQNNGTEKWFVNKDGYSTGGSLLANSSGTVAIANDSADVLEANSGWLYIAATDGTVYRVPAWAL